MDATSEPGRRHGGTLRRLHPTAPDAVCASNASFASLAGIDDRAILDRLSDAIVAADDGNRILYCNPAVERLLGWSPDELEGQPLVAIVPPRLREAHLEGFGRYLVTQEPHLIGRAVRVPAQHRDGHEVEIELTLSAFEVDERLLFVAALRDLSDRVQLERQLAMTSYFKATSEVAVLLGLSGQVSGLEDAAPRVLEAIGSSLGWQLGALWTVDEGGDHMQCVAVWSAPDVAGDDFAALCRETVFGRGVGLPGRVWESGAPAWVEDVLEDANFPRAAVAARQGLHGAFAFPVSARGRLLGVVEFFHRDRQPRDPDLLGVVATVGVQLGQFVDRRRAEDELRASGERFAALAGTLQASLLPPHLPAIPGLDLAARYRPAAVDVEVGGDFYDLFPTRGAGWGVVIGDVCGKGAEAASMTALARYTIRAAAMQARRPRRVLGLLNEAMLRQDDHGPFITVAYASVRATDDGVELVLSLGGHPQPLLVAPDGRVEAQGRPGSLLGVLDTPVVYDQVVRLRPGDALVLYTDGVIEARGEDGMLGEDGLAAALRGVAGRDATAIADAVLAAVEAFEGRAAQDDLAVLVLRVPS